MRRREKVHALLRQQLIILRRQVKRPTCKKTDRFLLLFLARMMRTWKQGLFIVQPETVLRWHRELYRLFWKRTSKADARQPKLSPKTIALIQEMARNNRLWGAERIRGELLKLDIRVCKRTIQKYMRRVRPVLATWYICSEKATVRARERPFTRCRSTCNQVKCEDVDRCSFGSEKINTSSSRRSLC